MPDGWMWLLAKRCFSPKAPTLHRVHFKALKYVQLSWCARDGHANWANCFSVFLHITTVPHKSPSTHLCCLYRWRTVLKGEQGVRDNWPITFIPEAQLLRYNTFKAWLHMNLFSFSYLIHATAPNSPMSSQRRVMPSDRGFSLCACRAICLLCFAWCCTVLNAW